MKLKTFHISLKPDRQPQSVNGYVNDSGDLKKFNDQIACLTMQMIDRGEEVEFYMGDMQQVT